MHALEGSQSQGLFNAVPTENAVVSTKFTMRSQPRQITLEEQEGAKSLLLKEYESES